MDMNLGVWVSKVCGGMEVALSLYSLRGGRSREVGDSGEMCGGLNFKAMGENSRDTDGENERIDY